VPREYQKVKCKAHKTNGDPCPNWSMKGQMVCVKHGGGAPQNRAAAMIRIEEAKARKELARLDVEPVTNALEALQLHAAIVIAWRDRCAEMVNKLEDRIRFESSVKIEQLRSEVVLWERALDRASVTLAALARAQVDERLARIRQQQADMLAEVMTLALADAGITGDQAAALRTCYSRRLRAIAA